MVPLRLDELIRLWEKQQLFYLIATYSQKVSLFFPYSHSAETTACICVKPRPREFFAIVDTLTIVPAITSVKSRAFRCSLQALSQNTSLLIEDTHHNYSNYCTDQFIMIQISEFKILIKNLVIITTPIKWCTFLIHFPLIACNFHLPLFNCIIWSVHFSPCHQAPYNIYIMSPLSKLSLWPIETYYGEIINKDTLENYISGVPLKWVLIFLRHYFPICALSQLNCTQFYLLSLWHGNLVNR